MASACKLVGFSVWIFSLICPLIQDTSANGDDVYSIIYDTKLVATGQSPYLHVITLDDQSVGSLHRVRRQADAELSSSNNTNGSLATTQTSSPPLTVTSTSSTTTTTTPRPESYTTTTTPTTTTTTTTTTTPTLPLVDERPSDNVTIFEDTNHKYYISSVVRGREAESLWIDEEKMAQYNSKIHASLSNSYRVAATVKLSFTFLFYGHEVNQVTIATGGFLYVSEFLHQWLTATQYIAPLMANFDTQLGSSSYIHYADTGTFFVVWWKDVYLKDYEEAGPFSFQAIINKNGSIVFNYHSVPVDIRDIPKAQHPVKIGLSDAYYIDTPTGPGVKRRTIYEYHRVEITADRIFNMSSVIIRPMETCIQQKTCVECLTANISFNCQYCLDLKRCSDGMDRHRQEWLNQGCHNQEKITPEQCPSESSSSASVVSDSGNNSGKNINITAIIIIVMIVCLIVTVSSVILYGYLKPQSSIGLWMIEHRPSQLRERLSKVRFFKREDGNAEKYEVSVA